MDVSRNHHLPAARQWLGPKNWSQLQFRGALGMEKTNSPVILVH